MSTLVTGGSGVVGRALVSQLVASGRAVRALVRSDPAAATVTNLGAVPVRGDILDYGSLIRSMQGCDVVYHVAGSNEMCLADPSTLFRVNVDGSRNTLRAAAAAGVRRMVFTSSATTLGEGRGSVGDERSPHRGSYLSNYERSKHEAEQALLSEETNVELVVVNPSSVQGPGRATGTGKLFLDLINGKIPVVVDSRFSIIDIGDCAAGHILAERNGTAGERYVLSGFTLSTSEAVQLLEQLTGLEFPPACAARRPGDGRGCSGRTRVPADRPSAPLLPGDDAGDVVRSCLRRIASHPGARARIHPGRDHPPENDRLVCRRRADHQRASRALSSCSLRSTKYEVQGTRRAAPPVP